MSYNATPPPVPGFPPMPPAPPQKDRKTNAIVIASVSAAVAAVVAATITAGVTSSDEAKPAPTVTVTETESAEGEGSASDTAADSEPEPAAEPSGSDAYSLSDTVTYENDVAVSLSKFSRSVSSEYAAPENTPYAKFTIKVVNGSAETVDATELSVNCAYGDEGREGEEIFDDGLDGIPDTRILAGRSLSITWGCELPKNEKYLQAEVSPDFESETAIFVGNVK